MADRVRPYLFYDVALSICSKCYRKAEGKILFQDGSVYMTRRCPEHGWEKVLIADDIDYYRKCREVYIKPPEQPNRYNTPIRYGCPYDCGLCGDHEQHSCVSLIEVTDTCNLRCPVCYAGSGPERQAHRPLELIERMLDAVVRNEREPDVVQVSGGEPTIHPDFFAILDAARRRPIKHLMVNTNGIRLARDPDFAQRLADYMPGFELYLQFDSFERDTLMALRGADLRDVHARALERCNDLGISVTLVATVKKGLNDGEIGRIIDFGLTQPCVRGVTFQPIQNAGRVEGFDPATDRLTLTEVRRRILEQTTIFGPDDVIPVPCHPDSIAMAYALKLDEGVVPFTGLVPRDVLLDAGRNTITFEKETALREYFFKLFATNHSPESSASTLRELLCCLPKIEVPTGWNRVPEEQGRVPTEAGGASTEAGRGPTEQVRAPTDFGYDRLFRVIIMQFIDLYSFDIRSVKKSCVHIVHPDGRLIPFDTYNLFYRDDFERTRLGPIRAALEPGGDATPFMA